jgi:hypothetical protein
LRVCNDIFQLAHPVYVQLPALLEQRHKNRNRGVINMRQNPGSDCTPNGRQSRTTTAGGRSHLHLRQLERGAWGWTLVDASKLTRIASHDCKPCKPAVAKNPSSGQCHRRASPLPSNHGSPLLNLGVLFFGSGWNLTWLATLNTFSTGRKCYVKLGPRCGWERESS